MTDKELTCLKNASGCQRLGFATVPVIVLNNAISELEKRVPVEMERTVEVGSMSADYKVRCSCGIVHIFSSQTTEAFCYNCGQHMKWKSMFGIELPARKK